MNVDALMTTNLQTCAPDHSLDCAARIMWETDCGVVPVVDAAQRVVGMITDRDICVAAYTQNKLLHDILISSVGMKSVITVRPFDSVETAEALMQRHQVRRLAVIGEGDRLVGVLSLSDLARGAGRSPRDLPVDGILRTLAAISQARDGHAQTNASVR
jgi:CBS domain-containing protein